MNTCVVVLGMHRSGTSMVAGILYRLGINMGSDLIGPVPSNPYGHYEDKEFVALNDKILYNAGGSWHKPPAREDLLEQGSVYKDEIIAITNKINNAQVLSGWKDPRTSLTIELFYPYLSKPKFIVCHRASLQVADSLKKRSGLPIEEGVNLKGEYDRRINDFFARNRNLIKIDLYYNDVLANTNERIRKIIDLLRIEPSLNQIEQANQFVVPK